MTASVISGLILFFCLLQLVSPDPPIHLKTAKPGDDVILPCKAPNYITIAVVKWSRSDLKRHVFLKTDGHLNTADQDPSYVNRVQLEDDEMKNGDLSLILKNVNSNDGGTYVCSFKEEEGDDQIKPISIVQLKVKDSQKQIAVQPGGDVTLPCRAPNVTIAAVEWIRPDLEKRVYFKSDGHLNTADQDPSYVNRVQLEDDEMKNGELSLILKNVNSNDGGTYVCRCVEKTGRRRKRSDQMKVITSVQLKVKGPTDGDSESGKDTEGTEGGHLGVFPTVTLIAALVAVVGQVGVMVFNIPKGRSEKKPVLPVHDPEVQQLQENENSQKNITNNI